MEISFFEEPCNADGEENSYPAIARRALGSSFEIVRDPSCLKNGRVVRPVAPSGENSRRTKEERSSSARFARTRLEYAIVDSRYRYVESTAAEIEDRNVPFTASLFVEAVSNSRGSRLVNDPRDIQAGDSADVLGSPTPRVIELYAGTVIATFAMSFLE